MATAARRATWSSPAHAEPDYEDAGREYSAIGNLYPGGRRVGRRHERHGVRAARSAPVADRLGRTVLGAPRADERDRGACARRMPREVARARRRRLRGRRRRRPRAAGADAGGAGRAGGARPERRQRRRAGRRLRLLHQQVQSRHPGAAPARLRLQAVPVFGGARARLHAGQRHPRCADRAGGHRQRGHLAPGELDARLRRPDAPARGAGALAQPGLDPHPQGARHRPRRSTTSPASASTPRRCRTT